MPPRAQALRRLSRAWSDWRFVCYARCPSAAAPDPAHHSQIRAQRVSDLLRTMMCCLISRTRAPPLSAAARRLRVVRFQYTRGFRRALHALASAVEARVALRRAAQAVARRACRLALHAAWRAWMGSHARERARFSDKHCKSAPRPPRPRAPHTYFVKRCVL